MNRHLIAASSLVGLFVIASQSAYAGSYSDAVLSDNPIAYWPMNGNADDVSGNNHNGAVDGGTDSVTFDHPGLVPAESGSGAVSLAGMDRIIVPGFEKIGATGYSAEYWVSVTEFPTACCDNFVGDGEAGGDFFMMNYLIGPGQGDTGAVRPHYSFANTPVSLTTQTPNVLELDTTFHVVTTWDATDPNNNNGKIYFNGQLVLEGNVTGNVPAPGDTGDNKIYIGRDDRENRPSNFIIDEVAFYDYPLTDAQVESHFAIGSVPEPNSAVLLALGGSLLLLRRQRK